MYVITDISRRTAFQFHCPRIRPRASLNSRNNSVARKCHRRKQFPMNRHSEFESSVRHCAAVIDTPHTFLFTSSCRNLTIVSTGDYTQRDDRETILHATATTWRKVTCKTRAYVLNRPGEIRELAARNNFCRPVSGFPEGEASELRSYQRFIKD